MMNSTDIAFPHLGIYLKNVPMKFTLFGNFTIAMYGIIFAIGVLGGLYVASYNAKKNGIDEDSFWGFLFIEIILSLLGARFYYIVCSWSDFAYVFEHDGFFKGVLNLFNFRAGGIAIYGAVIAAFIVLFAYCRIKKQNAFIHGDSAIPGLMLGQAIGRWGNFFNREVFGDYTDGPFAMALPYEPHHSEFVRDQDVSIRQLEEMSKAGVNYIQAHPTFLYESVWNLAVFAILMFYRKHKKFNGEICLLYFFGYGVGRFWIEGIRTDQLKIPGTTIPISQVVAIILIVVAIVGEILARTAIAKGKLPKVLVVKSDAEYQKEARERKEAAEKKRSEKSRRVVYEIKASEPDYDEAEDEKSDK